MGYAKDFGGEQWIVFVHSRKCWKKIKLNH